MNQYNIRDLQVRDLWWPQVIVQMCAGGTGGRLSVKDSGATATTVVRLVVTQFLQTVANLWQKYRTAPR